MLVVCKHFFFFYFNFLDIDLMQLDIVKRQNISKKQLQN